MSKIKNLEELLIDELKDLHNAENQLVKALPKMAEAASNPNLKEAFEGHLAETRNHVARLDTIFAILNLSAGSKTCHAMKGLIEEGEEAIKAGNPDAVRDANLIGAALRVEHYEIAAYGTARAFAQKLTRNDISELLQNTLNEEGAANKKLITIASAVNSQAYEHASSET